MPLSRLVAHIKLGVRDQTGVVVYEGEEKGLPFFVRVGWVGETSFKLIANKKGRDCAPFVLCYNTPI